MPAGATDPGALAGTRKRRTELLNSDAVLAREPRNRLPARESEEFGTRRRRRPAGGGRLRREEIRA
ncbi:hypothetical protein GCM10009532_12390 [Microbacterium aurantiacum]